MAEEERPSHKEEPIIIKKRKGHGGHPYHGGAWKVAYADFVTAMMAFFIVMWILASNQEVKESVSSYFKDPGAFKFAQGKIAVPVNLKLKPAGKGEGAKGNSKEKFVVSFEPEMRDSLLSKMQQIATRDSSKAAEKVKGVAESLKKYFNELVNAKPDLKEFIENIRIEVTEEGMRIKIFEADDGTYFESGSARLKSRAMFFLEKIAKEIGKLPNNVEVEGHTDQSRFSKNAGYTNWELSCDRANMARAYLERNGLWSDLGGGQVTKVIGYADSKPSNPANPFDKMNRRIEIFVRNMGSSEFMNKAKEQLNEE
ncbi:MAG: outer membrane protein, OmpA/MotB family [Ignavibacteria bacterium]|nr:outer membrane protein, OmpA/MotB family [Ignavibacteria bacterium]